MTNRASARDFVFVDLNIDTKYGLVALLMIAAPPCDTGNRGVLQVAVRNIPLHPIRVLPSGYHQSCRHLHLLH